MTASLEDGFHFFDSGGAELLAGGAAEHDALAGGGGFPADGAEFPVGTDRATSAAVDLPAH